MLDNAQMVTTLPASDIERARQWYKDKLGLDPKAEGPPFGLYYEAGGLKFAVYPSEFAGTNKATAAGIEVSNFDEVVADLKAKGVTFEEIDFGEMGKTVDGVMASPDGGKGAWIRDSEDNILGLSTPMNM
jgi:catechol 2,3-dioxygenase-like lactoylglutathione lyase family enzyme